jgi:hypothetical protein
MRAIQVQSGNKIKTFYALSEAVEYAEKTAKARLEMREGALRQLLAEQQIAENDAVNGVEYTFSIKEMRLTK